MHAEGNAAMKPGIFADVASGLQVEYAGTVGALSAQLDKAVGDCLEENASLAMRLTFKQVGGRVTVSGRLSARLKQKATKPKPAHYFVHDGTVSADDPRQIPLPLAADSGIAAEEPDDEAPWEP